MAHRIDPRVAEDDMRSSGLEPLESYPGLSYIPWKCQCIGCGAIVTPVLRNIRSGQGGCIHCGRTARSAKRTTPAETAEAEMLAAGLRPLEKFQRAATPWLCECLKCGVQVRPMLTNVRRLGTGCWSCGRRVSGAKQRGDSVQAVSEMQSAGYSPLHDYPGAGKPWRCTHNPCGREVVARLMKIRAGHHCCNACANWGFKGTEPAIVYVLHHRTLMSVKVGVADMTGRRLRDFGNSGWEVVGCLNFRTGYEARSVEKNVLRHIRKDLMYPVHLTPEVIGYPNGWTETTCADLLTPYALWQLVKKYS